MVYRLARGSDGSDLDLQHQYVQRGGLLWHRTRRIVFGRRRHRDKPAVCRVVLSLQRPRLVSLEREGNRRYKHQAVALELRPTCPSTTASQHHHHEVPSSSTRTKSISGTTRITPTTHITRS